MYHNLTGGACVVLLEVFYQTTFTERVEALRNCSSIYQVASADFTRNVTIQCLQFDPPLHCHGSNKQEKTIRMLMRHCQSAHWRGCKIA